MERGDMHKGFTKQAPEPERPPEPKGYYDVAWYRGFEVGYSHDAAVWGMKEPWVGYRGGCDLDAHTVTAATYDACLDAIDEELDEERNES